MTRFRAGIPTLLALAASCASLSALAQGTRSLPAGGTRNDPVPGVNLEQKLNSQIPLDAIFQDEDGKTVRIGDYLGKRPVVLNLIFYRCPGVCSLELEGMLDLFKKLPGKGKQIGEEFDVVTVSIDPKETPRLAADKKAVTLDALGRPEAAKGWHFLVGDKTNIDRIADSIGYRYKYNPDSPNVQGQFAHPAGIIVLTAEGKVSRYFFGTRYRPTDVSL
jgi:protein SCO1/2